MAAKKQRPAFHRASAPSNYAMLNWVACYVTEINGLESASGEKVEIIASNGNDSVIVRRTDKDVPTAFRRCVASAMKQLALSIEKNP